MPPLPAPEDEGSVDGLLPLDPTSLPPPLDDLRLSAPSAASSTAPAPTPSDPAAPFHAASSITGGSETGSMSFQIIGDRYLVLGQLGSGGNARVLRVRHISLGREFALKIINIGSSSDQAAAKGEELGREARTISGLEHPNIVQVTDFGDDPLVGFFIVMEQLKGETLYDYIERKGPLPLDEALRLALQAADALGYMHEQGFVHRDLKPENLYLHRIPGRPKAPPVLKLIDFGLANRDAKMTMKTTAEAMGTPVYMSPEQIRGLKARPYNDIYAMGVLLYELLTGQPPFLGTLEQVVTAHIVETPKSPSSHLEAPLDHDVEALILSALAKKPADRPESMADLSSVLQQLMLTAQQSFQTRPSWPGEQLGALAGSSNQLSAIENAAAMIFTHAPWPQVQLNAGGRVRVANAPAAELCGVPLDQLRGRTLAETPLGQHLPELSRDVFAVISSGEPVQRHLSPDDQSWAGVRLLVWIVPLPEPDGRLGAGALLLPVAT